jgi:MICOS complex subunit MIC26
VNSFLNSAFNLEQSFTQTIASLAPPRGSNEQVLPGAIYVLVSAMAGSIVTRRNNILLRFSVPVAAGITAGNFFIPITMRNIGDLAWSYEKRFPVIAETHERTQERIQRFWETGKAHTAMSLGMAQDKIQEGKQAVEDYVKKGK